MPHDTAVDAMLADPRRAVLLDDFAARIHARRPVRWHRLIHDTLGCQMGASMDLADITDMYWRLTKGGVPVHIVSEWLSTAATP